MESKWTRMINARLAFYDRGGHAMRRIILTVLLPSTLLAFLGGGVALATRSEGLISNPLAEGKLDPIKTKAQVGDWKVELETKGQTNVTVVRNTVQPGGHFGWHTHPGPSIVVVESGTATFYRGDDPECTPTTYVKGQAFADPAGGLVHIVRNNGTEPLVVVVTRFLPVGAPSRSDAEDPRNCL